MSVKPHEDNQGRIRISNIPLRSIIARAYAIPDLAKMRAGVMTIRNAGSIADLALEAQPHVDRPVVDATALSGNFEWTTMFCDGAHDR